MFKNLISKIKLKLAERRYKRKIDLNAKKFYIKLALIQYYNDIDKMHDVVDIPAHIRADRVMTKVIKRPSDIDRLYKKSLEYQAQL